MSKYGVFSGPRFPAFRLITERYRVSLRIQSECGKIRTRHNSVLGHFLLRVDLMDFPAYVESHEVYKFLYCSGNFYSARDLPRSRQFHQAVMIAIRSLKLCLKCKRSIIVELKTNFYELFSVGTLFHRKGLRCLI